MANLFNILEGFIRNIGDMIYDRAEIESHLNDLDEIKAYAEACNERISTADAARISDAGLAWVSNVNDGDGEWDRYRADAESALSDEG